MRHAVRHRDHDAFAAIDIGHLEFGAERMLLVRRGEFVFIVGVAVGHFFALEGVAVKVYQAEI